MTLAQCIMEQAAQICEAQIAVFLDPRYATQPGGSLAERHACIECARAIRAAAALMGPPEPSQEPG